MAVVPAMTGDDVARFLEANKTEAVALLRERFVLEYPDSDSNAMDGTALDNWSFMEVDEFCRVLRGEDPEIRPHDAYEGDVGQNVDELIQPITTFIEGRLFIARTFAYMLWHRLEGPVQTKNSALKALDSATLRMIRANLQNFVDTELPDGSVMRGWDFSFKAAGMRAASRPARPTGPVGAPRPTLTQREKEIARLVASGRTNGEIASALGLSQSTVKNRLVRIFDKLGVNTRAELASRMARDEL